MYLMVASVSIRGTPPVGSQAKFWVPVVVVRVARKPSPLYVYELSGPQEPMTSMMTSAVPYAFRW